MATVTLMEGPYGRSSASAVTFSVEGSNRGIADRASWSAAAPGESTLGHIPMHLAFSNLCYTVGSGTSSKLLLDRVSAYFLPGRMAALMGPSGAGKSTLLDAVSGRKTQGVLTFDSLVFGTKAPSTGFLRRWTGYVEQFDTLIGYLTVEEMLRYTCELKRPESESPSQKAAVVEAVLEQLALKHVRSHVIGSATSRGISGGQAKRVNIGLALVTDPAVLFLDEPTTGLDSATSEDIMASVKRLAADRSITVLSTIHSPSTRTVAQFDDLLLLLGGRTVFFGPLRDASPSNNGPSFRGGLSSPPLAHFAGLGIAPDASALRGPRFNVVEWLVQVTGGGVKGAKKAAAAAADSGRESGMDSNRVPDFPAAYADSPLAQSAATALVQLLPPGGGAAVAHSGVSETTTSTWKGVATIFWYRTLKTWTGDPIFLLTRLGEKVAIGFCIFSLFLLIAQQYDAASLQTTVGVLFLLPAMPVFVSVAYVPGLFGEKKLFTRERNDGCYYASTYMLAKIIEEGIPALLGAIIFVCTLYYSVGFQGNFGLFLFAMYLTALASIGMAYAIAAMAPTLEVAFTAQMGWVISQMFFVGLFILENSIPNYWQWFRYLVFWRYAWRALMVNHFNGAGDPTLFPGNGDRSTVLQFYNLKGESDWANVGELSAFVFGYLALAYVALAYIKHEKR